MTTSTKAEAPMNIYQILSKISEDAGALAPEQKPGGGVPFPFRGVDSTVNHLSPFLRKYGIVVIPSVQSVTMTPREVGNRVVKTTEVVTRFTFYAPDGSNVEATTAGLADDFADRSTAQAQSVAFRIALLQTFALPTQSAEPEQTGQAVEDERPKVAETVAGKLRDEIAEFIKNENNPYTNVMVNELGNKLTGKQPGEWMQSAGDLKKIAAALKQGVTV